MYTGIQHFHSYLAYLLLAVLIVAILVNLIAFLQGKQFSEANRKMALYGLIATHLQVVLGLILYFVSPMGLAAFSGAAMKDPVARLYFLEHPLMMLLAAVLITIGYSKSKRIEASDRKFRIMLAFYAIGLVFILSRIPWANWLN